jgi:hypothetical protein
MPSLLMNFGVMDIYNTIHFIMFTFPPAGSSLSFILTPNVAVFKEVFYKISEKI